jgi:hypothetical protein
MCPALEVEEALGDSPHDSGRVQILALAALLKAALDGAEIIVPSATVGSSRGNQLRGGTGEPTASLRSYEVRRHEKRDRGTMTSVQLIV